MSMPFHYGFPLSYRLGDEHIYMNSMDNNNNNMYKVYWSETRNRELLV
jgi:hypothetical protein